MQKKKLKFLEFKMFPKKSCSNFYPKDKTAVYLYLSTVLQIIIQIRYFISIENLFFQSVPLYLSVLPTWNALLRSR